MDRKGFVFALGAYVMWGLFPIYWKWLNQVSPTQIIGHRISWSFIILLTVIFLSRQFTALRQAAVKKNAIWIYSATAILICINWLVYVWAVNSDYIVEASLGYFINPLVSVLFAVLFFRERLQSLQWLAILLAALGVIYLSISYGRLPWIALTLAITFSIYGLLKKLAPLGSFFGMTLETGILVIPAVVFLFYSDRTGTGAFLNGNLTTDLFLIGAGVITIIPLLMFASAARRLPLSMLGIMEYIAPTIAFLLGVFIYKEPFNIKNLIGFGVVWIALVLFITEGLLKASPE